VNWHLSDYRQGPHNCRERTTSHGHQRTVCLRVSSPLHRGRQAGLPVGPQHRPANPLAPGRAEMAAAEPGLSSRHIASGFVHWVYASAGIFAVPWHLHAGMPVWRPAFGLVDYHARKPRALYKNKSFGGPPTTKLMDWAPPVPRAQFGFWLRAAVGDNLAAALDMVREFGPHFPGPPSGHMSDLWRRGHPGP